MHPILDALDNTQYDWIKKLLFTFNEGNIGKFEALAPLFPQEVRDGCGEPWQMGEADSGLADSGTKLPVSSTEDLSHGAYRVGVQTECQ